MARLEVSAPPVPRSEEVLTPEALAFVADLDARFHDRRDELLAARRARRADRHAVPPRLALGQRAAGIDNLMEDAATAEISRSQVWQWVHNGVRLDTGVVVTHDLVERIVAEEHAALAGTVDDDARRLFVECALDDDYPDFLTLQAYDVLLARGD